MTQAVTIRCFCLALALLPMAAGAQQGNDPLGRLFFSPEQRVQLERQRRLGLPDIPQANAASVRLDGMVRRSDGRTAAWVNGIPQYDGAAPSGIAVRQGKGPGQATVSGADQPPVGLDVGQSVNRATGEKRDPLNGGRIVIKRSPPAAP
jgi:hypothetical protein